MAELSLIKCAMLVLLAAAVAIALPTEDKASSSEGGIPLPESQPRIFFPPECRPGLCPFIKKVIPDSYYKDHDGYEEDHDPAPSLCGNMCNNDLVCPVGQRCCATNCGYVCHPVVNVAPPNNM